MRLLLDTHALVWFLSGNERLSKIARAAVEDTTNEVFVSSVSIWELVIKHQSGRLKLALEPRAFVALRLEPTGFKTLNVTLEHAVRLADLPLHHRDPFDRMLASQCLVEKLDLISVDSAFDAYALRRIW